MHIPTDLLQRLSELSTPAICCAFVGHLVVFVMLWMAYRHNLRTIAQSLEDFTRGLRHRSVLDRGVHLSDQIEAFLTDVKDALDTPARTEDRRQLSIRMSILDEKRRYLHALVGGRDGKGWEFGRPILKAELVHLAEEVPGVEGVDSLGIWDEQIGRAHV